MNTILKDLFVPLATTLGCLHSKKFWVILTQFWVKYGKTQTLD